MELIDILFFYSMFKFSCLNVTNVSVSVAVDDVDVVLLMCFL